MKLYLQSFYFIFFLVATAGTCHSWNPFSSLSKWWNDRKAYKTYLSSDLDKTIDLLKKKQIDDPSHAETAYNLGVVLYKKGKYEEAAQQFDVASHLGALEDQLYLNSSINAGQCFFKQALSLLGGEEWEKNCPPKETLLQAKEKAYSAVSRYQLSLAREAAHAVATKKKEEAEQLIQKIEDKLKEQEQKEKEKKEQEQDKQKDQNNQDNQKKDQNNSQDNSKDNSKENNGNNSSNEKQNPNQDLKKEEQNRSEQKENDPSSQQQEKENKEEKPNPPQQTPQQQQEKSEDKNQNSEQKETSSPGQTGEGNEPSSPQQPEQKSDAEKIEEEKEQSNEQPQNEENEETASSPPEEKNGSFAPQNFKKRQMEAFLDQIEGKEKQAQKQRVRAMTGAAAHTPLMKGQKPW